MVELDYTNRKGNRRWRKVDPLKLYYGTSQYHSTPQLLLEVVDSEDPTQPIKTFTLSQVHAMRGTIYYMESAVGTI